MKTIFLTLGICFFLGCTTSQKELLFDLIPEPKPTATPLPTPTPVPVPTPVGQVHVDRSGYVATGDRAIDFGAWHGVDIHEGSIVVDGLTMDRLGYLQHEWIRAHGAPVPLWSEAIGHYVFGGY